MLNQLGSVLRWELKLTLARPSTWVYIGVFAGMGALLVTVLGGVFPEVALSLGTGGRLLINSPHGLANLFGGVAILGVPVTSAILGNAICRDFQYNTYPLFFTSGVSKSAYLGGRFCGAMAVNLLVLLGLAAGTAAATINPALDQSLLDVFRLNAYARPFALIVIPNLFITGAIFFSLAALTRRMLPNHVGGVVMLAGYMVAESLMGELRDRRFAALLDPFGMRALDLATQYWSIAEMNTAAIPADPLLLWNRLIWVAAAMGLLLVTFRRFSFSHTQVDARERRGAAAATPAAVRTKLQLPGARLESDWRAGAAQFLALTGAQVRSIMRSRSFIVITLTSILLLLLMARQIGAVYGTNIYPVTYAVEEVLSGTFALFMLVLIVLYSGELIWDARQHGMDQIVDALPVGDAIVAMSRFAALCVLILVALGIVLACGLVTQASYGYFNFDIPLYLRLLLGVRLPDYLLMAVLAFTLQVLVNQKYVGHLVVVLTFAAITALPAIGVRHNLLLYGGDGGMAYSDMNGFGPFGAPFLAWKLYWGSAAVLLLLLSTVLWVRGVNAGLSERIATARARMRRTHKLVAGTAFAAFAGMGGFIFYNTNILNEYTSAKQQRDEHARYEKSYKRFSGTPQPRISAVTLRVELYPSRADAEVSGQYRLVNRTGLPVDSLHLRVPADAQVKQLATDVTSRRILSDSVLGYYMLRLEPPLAAGDSMLLSFDLAFIRKGFPNSVDRVDIVRNGTFLHSLRALPGIGYSPQLELADDNTRESRGLPPQERLPPPSDTAARMNTYISSDADWVSFDAIVGTDRDQVALAPGELKREWTENGRRYFHYTAEHPVLNFFAFLSGRYEVARDEWNGVSIEIFHHPAHDFNVARMIGSIKRSLEYYTANFGPYQHNQVRIVEFPRYIPFAQALPGTIPYSEAVGFIASVDGEHDIDYPFYVTAHEVAHQWWAHQVVPGNVRGAAMLTETMAQYAALMVMEKEYGRDQMYRFLEYELDKYLLGRTFERKREVPLAQVENQPYIHYNKGSLATYALRDRIGEAAMNGALRGFLEAYAFKPPPYPASTDLLDNIRRAVPDSLRYMIEDFFETITLYDLRVDSAITAPAANGRWKVDVHLRATKLRADSIGREVEVPFNEWIDVAVYADTGSIFSREEIPVHAKLHLLVSGEQSISLEVPRKPARVAVDPQKKLIARNTRLASGTVREAGADSLTAPAPSTRRGG